MQYNVLHKNIAHIISSIKYIHIDQLCRLFSDVTSDHRVRYITKGLLNQAEIRWWKNDPETGILTTHANAGKSDEDVYELIQALWVVTTKKSSEIRDLFPGGYPCQVGFITTTNDLYDVTICNDIHTVQLAVRKWRMALPEDGIDRTKHIAVVPNREICDDLKIYGFSAFCIIGAGNIPQFYNVH